MITCLRPSSKPIKMRPRNARGNQRAPTATFQVKPQVKPCTGSAQPSRQPETKRNARGAPRCRCTAECVKHRSVKAHPSILTGNRPGNCQGNERRRCGEYRTCFARPERCFSPASLRGATGRPEPVRRHRRPAAQSDHHLHGADAADHRAGDRADAGVRLALPRRSTPKRYYEPDWDHSTQLELVIWAAPLLIIIALGRDHLDQHAHARPLPAARPHRCGTRPWRRT